MDIYAKFVDGVKRVVGPSSFAKHTTKYRMTALLTMMQKMALLATESMLLDQEDTKAAKEVARTVAAEAYSLLETARQEIVDLKIRLDVIQVKYESVNKEIKCYIPQIQDLECAISEFYSTAYAKDEELIDAYNQVIHFKKVIDRLEPQVFELQGALKINDNLKKEVDELQLVRACLLKENEQLNVGEVGAQARAIRGETPDGVAVEGVTTAEGVTTK
ncbi:hypothetical protein ACFX10_022632 [Malus domestica]